MGITSHDSLFSKHREFVNFLLEALRFNENDKADTITIEQLCQRFHLSDKRDLPMYLMQEVDSATLFITLLEIIEPFAQMLQEIYAFLSRHSTSARSLQHIVIGEDAKNQVMFDIDVFPKIYKTIRVYRNSYQFIFDKQNIVNNNISPLFLTEGLLSCGYCTDKNYHKGVECQSCDASLRERFTLTFQQLKNLIEAIPPDRKNDPDIQQHCYYYEEASRAFFQGLHYSSSHCSGSAYWEERLRECEFRFGLVGERLWGQMEFDMIQGFFQLPFWKERDRLYEVWTLIHFISLFYGVAIELQIKNDQWHLLYGESKDPVAYIRGKNFVIEIWYQRKLSKELETFFDEPVEPEILFFLKEGAKAPEPLLLLECKDRAKYSDREIKIRAAFYNAQVPSKLAVFCNYLDYESGKLLQSYAAKSHYLFCAQFHPGGPIVPQVDQEVLAFLQDQLHLFVKSILIDTSTTMTDKDVLFVHQRLLSQTSSSSAMNGLCGFFAERLQLCMFESLPQRLRRPPNVGKNAHLQKAIEELTHHIQNQLGKEKKVTIYVITNCIFHSSDWEWLEQKTITRKDIDIVFVGRRNWLTSETLDKLRPSKNFTSLLF